MNELALVEMEDLFENPTPRVPVALCLDCSGSMMGEPIRELNEGVKTFYQAINDDEIARFSAEICIVTFGPASLEADFATLDTRPQPPVLTASGNTPMGEAVQLALDSLEERKAAYRASGVDYYQPWLVLMTDGKPNGNNFVLQQQITRVADMVERKKLTVFPIGIGSDADMNVLAKFSPGRSPLRLQGLKFSDFFSWLSKSVSRVSQSTPGDKVTLDVDGIRGWAEL
ncbi:VWA domain-containing protein [uncultured Slackia sp.]|uniref:vWA domain-containing protein n=1 Tax=uncultured Slackia sp. TaxID=665903 RepID=UPI002600A512|nr:VWA domain-containing protein [uncultured Slackia sp.]